MKSKIATFQETIWEYYQTHGRHDLPWRQANATGHLDPYAVMVSEIMLQQTQVPRVAPKFKDFLEHFPTIELLAAAPLSEVLTTWNGLGYNRRAKFLWQAAGEVVSRYGGTIPDDTKSLVSLPGIGPNTAGAILAYAYNKPTVFIETNIRTVFIYHFFAGQEQVDDKDIVDLVAHTLPDDPRQWYWALMDYGTYLKQTVGNLNTASKQYAKQSAFQGSRRQIRGKVLRLLGTGPRTVENLAGEIVDERLLPVLEDLANEGLIVHKDNYYMLPAA
jgi:A/G-specific adenine glycosylase